MASRCSDGVRRKSRVRIDKAVKKAVSREKYITVPELKGKVKIKPTNDGYQLCVMMHADGSHPKNGWQPTAEQLMRGDWMVVG